MIQNTFIITAKDEWRDEACYMRAEYAARMEFTLPEKYRPLFANLIKDISLNDLMDNRDHKRAYEIMAQAMVSGTEGTWYSPHGDCLLHVLRKTFYETLLIIHGDYNPFKYDYCIVVLSKDVISERKWEELYLNGNSHPGNGKVLIGSFPRAV
jgi:hypothetical protein